MVKKSMAGCSLDVVEGRWKILELRLLRPQGWRRQWESRCRLEGRKGGTMRSVW